MLSIVPYSCAKYVHVSQTSVHYTRCHHEQRRVHSRKKEGGWDHSTAHRYDPTCFGLTTQQWQQINGAEHHDPDEVNEVPVHFARLDSKMLVFAKITTQRTNQADQQE